MNPFGTFIPSQFLPPASPKNIDVGVPWEYIRIINNSPYALNISFGGQGSINFPEGFLEDIPVDRSFNGKLTFTPVQNYAATAIARSLANYVTVNAYRAGELAHPQAQPIGTLGSTANISQAYQAAFLFNPGLNISAAGNTASSSLSSPPFPNMDQVSASNPGYLLLGYLHSSNARELIVPYRSGYREALSQTFAITIPNGGNTQVFQLTNATAITGLAFYGWSSASANVGAGSINIDRKDNNFLGVVPTPPVTGAGGTVQVDLTKQFGPYGFEGYAQAAVGPTGLRVQCNFFNTTGGNVTVTLTVTGSFLAFDDARLAVTFTDWATPANVYTLAIVRLDEVDHVPLNFLVPTPVTDPAMANFGTITYKVLNVTEYYATKYFGSVYTIDYVMPANLIIPGSGA